MPRELDLLRTFVLRNAEDFPYECLDVLHRMADAHAVPEEHTVIDINDVKVHSATFIPEDGDGSLAVDIDWLSELQGGSVVALQYHDSAPPSMHRVIEVAIEKLEGQLLRRIRLSRYRKPSSEVRWDYRNEGFGDLRIVSRVERVCNALGVNTPPEQAEASLPSEPATGDFPEILDDTPVGPSIPWHGLIGDVIEGGGGDGDD